MSDATYKISARPGYILCEDPPGYEVMWSEMEPKIEAIRAACERAECHKVLVRCPDIHMKLTTIEYFDLGKAIGEMNIQIAFEMTGDTLTAKNLTLLENAASNRGSPIRFFDNEADAKAWLGVE